jgi:cellulose synthase/poly-beta-1,6-N-acetylglucosamine synthase-like glycosyltransferase
MRDALSSAIWSFELFVLAYLAVLTAINLTLMLIGSREAFLLAHRGERSGEDDVFANPLTPGITLIAPAYDEEPVIVEAVTAMLGLRYPLLEVIVVDDGSTDGTFERLREAFDLEPVERAIPDDVPTVGVVRSTHAPADGRSLLVIRKDNAGRRSDPVNVGLNAARHPLVGVVDADSLLDRDALLEVVRPFVDDPERVVASGGTIRAANGCEVVDGRIVSTRMPSNWLARIQVVEYLRSFLLARSGWSRLRGLLIISGAFGLFRRDVLVRVGGMDLETIGEDAELVARIHRTMREDGTPYRVTFVSRPVCWTEVPEDRRTLGRQRRRWARGLAEVLWKHRRMMGNPRHRVMGLAAMPFYLLFELLAPVIELAGLVLLVLGLAFGLIAWQGALVLALAALAIGALVSVAAIAVEAATFSRYRRWSDIWRALAAAGVEFVGFRQLHAWWRLRGIFDFLRGGGANWGAMPRVGFSAHPGYEAAAETAATRSDETVPESVGGEGPRGPFPGL